MVSRWLRQSPEERASRPMAINHISMVIPSPLSQQVDSSSTIPRRVVQGGRPVVRREMSCLQVALAEQIPPTITQAVRVADRVRGLVLLELPDHPTVAVPVVREEWRRAAAPRADVVVTTPRTQAL